MANEIQSEQKVLEEGTPEWHEHRRHKFNASEAAAVLDLNPFHPQTPFQLFRVKRGLVDPDPENAMMRRGKKLEPAARRAAEEIMGEPMEPHVFTRGRFSASLDGVDFEGKVGLEAKTPWSGLDSTVAQHVKDHGEPPDYYYAQVQHQLYTSGVGAILFLVYIPDADPIYCWVFPNKDYQDQLVAAWESFGECLDQGNPPELTDRDTEEREDTEWALAAEALKDAKEKYDQAKAAYDEAKNRLIELANHPRSRGNGVVLTKVVTRGNFDYKEAARDFVDPEVLEKYRKEPSESWRPSFSDS